MNVNKDFSDQTALSSLNRRSSSSCSCCTLLSESCLASEIEAAHCITLINDYELFFKSSKHTVSAELDHNNLSPNLIPITLLENSPKFWKNMQSQQNKKKGGNIESFHSRSFTSKTPHSHAFYFHVPRASVRLNSRDTSTPRTTLWLWRCCLPFSWTAVGRAASRNFQF